MGQPLQDTQEEVEVLGEVLVRRPAVLVSGALVLLGVVDCIVSLACVTVSAREACGLYTKGEDRAHGLSEGHNRKERLYRWLGQQKTIFPIVSPEELASVEAGPYRPCLINIKFSYLFDYHKRHHTHTLAV